MEKDHGLPGGSNAPSAPTPSAPPSYEEAMAQSSVPVAPVHGAPYPVGSINMPMPQNQRQSQLHPHPQQGATLMPAPPKFTPQLCRFPQTVTGQQNFPQPPTEARRAHTMTYVMGPHPMKMTCPTCFADIKTTTVSDHQPSAHICCIVLCLIGCCLCSCLPYCMSAFMSVHHFCPNCKTYIATWKG
ncbi:lipopolysaccharide-induced tumor necrosis factor-alpha factor homolog [Cephus cinctus]|uniref:Lipopolysaccharide-induced tumor necrosis factor-alpha factor homolog n=1 Tax=Cephus cinctus TaxID=211228 RepID=A0AAJ7CGB3_CEPCN|nr:lipopolysaccharide-induced tumor necrosis factor-alpha factor homolog [Cephus cinctus]XP_015609985.1 lipopolysaccharide-induced tumor necrosis factor-alpha factor homolog [Cephus cinctus]